MTDDAVRPTRRTCRDSVVPAEQSETLADLRAQLDALRAVVQEALDLHSGRAQLNPALCETCLEARPCDTFFILDRGLKGGEE